MDLRDIVSVALTQGERVSLTVDPSPETDPTERWIVTIGSEYRAAGETPEAALQGALRELSQHRQQARSAPRLDGRARWRRRPDSGRFTALRSFPA